MSNIMDTIKLTNEFCDVLTDMERAGIPIDLVELDKLEKETQERCDLLHAEMYMMAQDALGDTPINLNSGEQLSMLMYSRKVKDKKRWQNTLGFYPKQDKFEKAAVQRKLPIKRFVHIVKHETEIIYKTTKEICSNCVGTGKVKADTSKRIINCKTCTGSGIEYMSTGKVGGLRVAPKKHFTSNAGFMSSNEIIEELLEEKTLNQKARKFVTLLNEYRKLKTYLSTSIGGIRNGLVGNILHANFNQAMTATGRLSSSNPNVQNFPRGGTFPIKRVFISKWAEGIVVDSDMSQLEFRCAVHLANDKEATQEIKDGLDIHMVSATVLGVSRQDAKPQTFKPLYGGKDWGLMKRYPAIKKWHEALMTEAVRTKQLVLTTGRTYAFPHVKRTAWGCTQQTKIKNYPVQGFASADVVPAIIIELSRALKSYKSYIMSTIHDSVIVDVHPDEFEEVIKIVHKVMNDGNQIMKDRFGIHMEVPLEADVKYGMNAFDTEEYVA